MNGAQDGLAVLSLCAGIGGLDLGIRLAAPSARTVCYVERELYSAAVLVARMQDGSLDPAPVWSDLTTFDGLEWRGVVDLVAAGYPCQPFSTAGRRAGTDDPRHLWPHVARIVRECAPGLVLLENVPGHLSLGFDEVCAELDGMGYRIAAGVFSAAEVGAPHRRERLFALAHRDGDGLGLRGERAGRDQGQPQPEPAGGGDEVGDPCGAGLEGSQRPGAPDQRDGTPAHGPTAEPGGAPVPAWPPGPAADWSGIDPALWPATQPPVRRVADGLPSRLDQLRALGNGVVPACAAHALRTLAAELRHA